MTDLTIENLPFIIPSDPPISGQIESIRFTEDGTTVNLIFMEAPFKGEDFWEVRVLGDDGTQLQPRKGTQTISVGGLTEFTSVFEPAARGEGYSVQFACVPLATVDELDSSDYPWFALHRVPVW